MLMVSYIDILYIQCIMLISFTDSVYYWMSTLLIHNGNILLSLSHCLKLISFTNDTIYSKCIMFISYMTNVDFLYSRCIVLILSLLYRILIAYTHGEWCWYSILTEYNIYILYYWCIMLIFLLTVYNVDILYSRCIMLISLSKNIDISLERFQSKHHSLHPCEASLPEPNKFINIVSGNLRWLVQ